MAVSCVILNYNDHTTTLKLVNRIRDYKNLDYVVVVDNASTDDSAKHLEKLAGGKVIFIQNDSNKGYGAGNNVGIKYSRDVLSCKYVLIANPDVEFEDETVGALVAGFDKADNCAVVSCVMKNAEGTPQISGWRNYGFMKNLLSTEPVCIRLFRNVLHYPKKYFENKEWCEVEAVPGSLLMVDAEKMSDVGLYDENMFLYEEERTLGFKLKQKGYKTVLLLDHSYIHRHSVSIKKSVKSAVARQKILHKTKMYYYKEYLHINKVQELFARVWLGLVMLEVRIATGVFKISW
ncbi:MAG: glycosyltransferase family 2 protein [Lachnospiraceae bacterium]|nr:glycosyltransferase family 2 protein [Lachnospiraceae bacterium]